MTQEWFGEIRRGDEAARVLAMAFREFRSYQLFKANEIAGTAQSGRSEADRRADDAEAGRVTMQVDSRPPWS